MEHHCIYPRRDSVRSIVHSAYTLYILQTSWKTPHTEHVEQLALSSSPPLQLTSVSTDCLVLWDIEDTFPLPPGELARVVSVVLYMHRIVYYVGVHVCVWTC